MKKKINLLGLLFSLFFASLNAQDNYYYYKGEKQYLALDKAKLDITTSVHFQKEYVKNIEYERLNLNNDLTSPDLMFANIRFHSNLKEIEYEDVINLLKNNKDIIAVHPNYITSKNKEVGMSSYFYVKLKEALDFDLLNKIAEQKKVVIVEQNIFLPLWYTLRCTKETSDNTLDVANYFYETGLFTAAVPDFLSDDLLCTNDPDFSQLWGLNNTSYPSIDIKACSAWNISQGAGIFVAVLDDGIELTHIDLQLNISPLSYDTESNSSPSKIIDVHGHGTYCAGIIGAIKDNDTLIVGVAPKCTLMSVSNSMTSAPNSRIKRADGINWAWKNGADVINNSWTSSVQYDVIDEAIDSAFVYGRNGKGTVIIFGSGNENLPVAYPANSNPDIIAVGAIYMDGPRAIFSNYGAELDVVAPGVNILSTVLNNGTTTSFGTSAAAPHVAGVAALILSANPNLTGQQVRDIIESTAQKVGGYNYQITSGRPNGTWNNEMGYGLVNARAAVEEAICFIPTTFTNQQVSANTTVEGCDVVVEDVEVTNNAKLILEGKRSVKIKGPFKTQSGSQLEVKTTPF